jgi:Dolichyl-phosphate-mannose-protein mannosyltransferase
MDTRDVPNRLTPTDQTPTQSENSGIPSADEGATPVGEAAVSYAAGWRARVAPIEPWLPLFLFCFAILYYASYALSGVDLGGEGGTVAVVSERLLQGQKPFLDTFLGYNVLWFYPIKALFKIFGPNFLVVRIFFFALSIATAMITYRCVERAVRQPWLALLAGLILVLVPGMQFRNYLGFYGVLNFYLVLEAYVLPHKRTGRAVWIVAAGIALGLTLLTRVDIGVFATAVHLGTLALIWIARLEPVRELWRTTLVGIVAVPILIVAVHVPVVWEARVGGFEAGFWQQYNVWAADMNNRLTRLQTLAAPAPTPATVMALPAATPTVPRTIAVKKAAADDRGVRPLPNPADVFLNHNGRTRLLVFNIYYPVLSGSLMVIGAVMLLLNGWFRRDVSRRYDAAVMLVGLASSLVLFPQYFFFRPDPQHVSEMMCVWIPTGACGLGIALNQIRVANRPSRWFWMFYSALSLIHAGLYIHYGLYQPWMGSIGRKVGAEKFFQAQNGVTGFVPTNSWDEYQQLYRTVREASKPGEYVLCLPYLPMINFMTDRPSYLYNLYVDNATRSVDFDQQMIAGIERYRPAVIAISDEPINEFPDSRFSVWAAPTLAYVREHYQLAGTFVGVDVYVREEPETRSE